MNILHIKSKKLPDKKADIECELAILKFKEEADKKFKLMKSMSKKQYKEWNRSKTKSVE